MRNWCDFSILHWKVHFHFPLPGDTVTLRRKKKPRRHLILIGMLSASQSKRMGLPHAPAVPIRRQPKQLNKPRVPLCVPEGTLTGKDEQSTESLSGVSVVNAGKSREFLVHFCATATESPRLWNL